MQLQSNAGNALARDTSQSVQWRTEVQTGQGVRIISATVGHVSALEPSITSVRPKQAIEQATKGQTGTHCGIFRRDGS